jgi:hypothetical protein
MASGHEAPKLPAIVFRTRHATDPLRNEKHLMRAKPVARIYDDIPNSQGTFINEQVMYVTDIAIGSTDVID